MKPRPEHRRFRAFNVGLAKTGTRSVAGMFAAYRALHEFLFSETARAVMERERGTGDEARFRAFVRRRDQLAQLDMDSTSCTCYFVDVIAQEFPDAKLLFVVRDCLSWLDSLLNMVLFAGPMMGPWMEGYFRRFLGPGYHRNLARDEGELLAALPDMVERGLEHWSATNRFVLQHLPGDRSLIVRTRDLSRSLPAVAGFVGVPPETLLPDMSHLNGARYRYDLLRRIEPALLAQWVECHCGDLMRDLFPGVTVSRFLAESHSP
ncbi:MAG TPA: sulfotransferase [Chloroflexota bacterium]|nr:sulfotransferase [Chloroflexota bacterium]